LKAIALVDGEHYAPVVRDALAALPYEWVGAIFVGGTEKLRPGADYGVALVDDFGGAELVVDLSDEPVLGPTERFRWISRALAAGLPYVGSDFRFDPPQFEPFELPSLAVAGTGKRVGKTAVAVHAARLLARDRSVVAVAMGRGGPAEPELVETPPTVDDLLALSRAGRHAASDHLELAAFAGVPAIGCRRAGGGLAGSVFVSNVGEGARLAASLEPDIVVFDGSGAALPPVETSARLLVTNSADVALAYLNLYRLLVSDAVVLMHAPPEDALRLREVVDIPVVRCELRLQPTAPTDGTVAVFTGSTLGDRAALKQTLEATEADTYVVELKAAAIDVVAEHAVAHGKRVVLASNEVVSVEGDLDATILSLVPAKVAV
jgi:cyclic 2,3-diphosphoglycerate synthetase